MRTAFPAQELPVRSALTVGVRCVNRTRRHAASVTVYSVLRACPSIQCSTPKLHQQITEGNKNVKPHNLNSAVRSANTARKQAVLRRQFGRSASIRQRRILLTPPEDGSSIHSSPSPAEQSSAILRGGQVTVESTAGTTSRSRRSPARDRNNFATRGIERVPRN